MGLERFSLLPFLSRCFLYRLYDINYSLLVYHEQNVSSTSETSVENELTTFHFDSVGSCPQTVYVQVAPSAQESLEDLAKLPRSLIALSKTSTVQQSSGKITVSLEPFCLSRKEMFFIGSNHGSALQCQIEETAYKVTTSSGPMGKIGTTGDFPCWKVSVMGNDGKGDYDLYSAHDWDLTALSIEKDWRPILEMRLAKKSL